MRVSPFGRARDYVNIDPDVCVRFRSGGIFVSPRLFLPLAWVKALEMVVEELVTHKACSAGFYTDSKA